MKATVPAKYHDHIVPTYRACPYFWQTRQTFQYGFYAALGCKRIVRDDGYLQSLNLPNVRLTFDHVARVEADGVVLTTGIHLDFCLEAVRNTPLSV